MSSAANPNIQTLTVVWYGNRSSHRCMSHHATGHAKIADALFGYVVPEPSTASLLALGLVGIAAVRRRRSN